MQCGWLTYWVSISGVTWPTMKLFIQLLEAPSAIPYGLCEIGQISAICSESQLLFVVLDDGDTYYNPRAGTPRISKMYNEEPDHSDRSPACSPMRGPLVLVLCKDDSNDHVAECHSDSASDKNWLAS